MALESSPGLTRYARRSASPASSASAGASSEPGRRDMTRHKDSAPITPLSTPSRGHDTDAGNGKATCGWICACLVGAIASTFLLVIYFLPTEGIFPVRVQLYLKPDKPTHRAGHLQIYPGENTSRFSYEISLDPLDISHNRQSIYNVIESYPPHKANEPPPPPYVHCWFSNPSRDQPCFFDRGWLGDLCTKEDAYGYNSSDPVINPCFLIRIEDSQEWAPEPLRPRMVPSSWQNEHDPAFLGFACAPKERERLRVTFERRPIKGFSVHYFPVAEFSPELYLVPAVMVQVKGLPRHDNLSIECWIRTLNKDLLIDYGRIEINFVHRKQDSHWRHFTRSPTARTQLPKTPRLMDQPQETPSISPNTTTTNMVSPVTTTTSTESTIASDSSNSTANTTTTTEEVISPIVS